MSDSGYEQVKCNAPCQICEARMSYDNEPADDNGYQRPEPTSMPGDLEGDAPVKLPVARINHNPMFSAKGLVSKLVAGFVIAFGVTGGWRVGSTGCQNDAVNYAALTMPEATCTPVHTCHLSCNVDPDIAVCHKDNQMFQCTVGGIHDQAVCFLLDDPVTSVRLIK